MVAGGGGGRMGGGETGGGEIATATKLMVMPGWLLKLNPLTTKLQLPVIPLRVTAVHRQPNVDGHGGSPSKATIYGCQVECVHTYGRLGIHACTHMVVWASREESTLWVAGDSSVLVGKQKQNKCFSSNVIFDII